MTSTPNSLSKRAKREKVALAYSMVEASLSETYFAAQNSVEREINRAMTILRGAVKRDLSRFYQTGSY